MPSRGQRQRTLGECGRSGSGLGSTSCGGRDIRPLFNLLETPQDSHWVDERLRGYDSRSSMGMKASMKIIWILCIRSFGVLPLSMLAACATRLEYDCTQTTK